MAKILLFKTKAVKSKKIVRLIQQNQQTQMKTKSNQRGFAPIIIIVVVVLAIAGLLAYQKTGKNTATKKTSSANQAGSSFSNLLGQKPSQPMGVILGATTTKSVDPKTGKGGVEVVAFSAKDPVIYVVMQVNKPKKGTKFEYVRYFSGKYVDHKSLDTTKDGVDYVSFKWGLKTVTSKRLAGNYKIKLYTNGNFEKELSYQIR